MADRLIRVTGAAAPLLRDDIDTDTISPGSRRSATGTAAEFAEKGSSTLAADLFAAWRYDDEGRERPEFVLNRAPFRAAKFLIAGANFGCGSSRESAVWMLKEWGIRCIIAASFSDIFANSCFANGLLPLALPWPVLNDLAGEAEPGAPEAIFTLDLEAGHLTAPSGRFVSVTLPSFRRDGLLLGLDEIAVTLNAAAEIERFIARNRAAYPWAYGGA
jgi:3-isopropylmalate/(R)-2-methylmalate dehydratase small subunit